VTDIGALGPDKGEGGKYLILPPGYEGVVPEGYFPFESKAFDHWLVLRASPDTNGDTAGPAAAVREKLNIYPLSEAHNPPAETFHDANERFNRSPRRRRCVIRGRDRRWPSTSCL